jgi:ArsR family transcriptional regulator
MTMNDNQIDLDRQVYELHAEMCKVFSHAKRLQIVNTLRDREMTVSDLMEKTGISMANLSQHLSMMRSRRILVTRRVGNSIYYRIANPKMLKAFDTLREVLFEQIEAEGSLLGQHGSRER